MSKTFRLGLFIVATLAILAAGIFVIGSKQLLFKSTVRVNAQFQNVAGLTDGAEVRVGGVRKGEVKFVNLPIRPDGKVTVVMDLDNATWSVVKKDSVASIKSEGLVGDKYVEISFGSDAAERIKEGDTIGSEPPMEVSALMKKTDQILDSAKDAVDNLQGTTSNMKSISAKIDQGKGSIGALVNDKTVYQEVTAGAAAFDEDMEALKHNFLLRGFFKNRGYEDASDVTKHEIAKLPAEQPIRTFAYDGGQLFAKRDTAKLRNQKTLNEVGGFLEQNNFGSAVVAAAVGMKGESDKAHMLTEGRAAVVRDYLAQNFRLDDKKIKTIGLGKTNGSGDNGQVEILVYPPSGASNTVATDRAGSPPRRDSTGNGGRPPAR